VDTKPLCTWDEASSPDARTERRIMPPERARVHELEEPGTPHSEGQDARSPAAGAAITRIYALGRAWVEREGLTLDSPDFMQRPRELLYYLLSHPEGRTKEQIGLALWPEASTAQLRSSFHDTVFRLRRALGAKEWVVFEKRRYGFGRSIPYSYDVEDFERNLSEARRLQTEAPDRAIEHLQEATGLDGGDFLEDTADGEWAMEIQDELRRAQGEGLLLLGGSSPSGGATPRQRLPIARPSPTTASWRRRTGA
jgi:hypothetical protein